MSEDAVAGVGLARAGEAAESDTSAIAVIRRHVAAGHWERALEAIARVQDPADLDMADEYRALCYVALRREADAVPVIDRLVLRNPLQAPRPQLPAAYAELYRAARRRLVPRLAQSSYSAARGSLDSRDYDAAIRQFQETLELIRSAEDQAALADLDLVASEFRVLAEQRQRLESAMRGPALQESTIATSEVDPGRLPVVSADAAPVAPLAASADGSDRPDGTPSGRTPDVTAVAAGAAPPPFTPIDRVHDATDAEVVPPVALRQTLPAWNPPWKQIRARSYSGRLVIVIAEDGTVESADIVQKSFASYDDELVRATADWRFEPARKRERAVRYRRSIDFVLRGDGDLAQR